MLHFWGKRGEILSQSPKKGNSHGTKTPFDTKNIICCDGCGRTNCNRGQSCAPKMPSVIFLEKRPFCSCLHETNKGSCALAESLGILSFNNPPHDVKSVLNSTIHNSQTSKIFHNLLNSTHPSIANILSKYESVFSGLGKLNANPVHFHLKPDAKPVIQPPRHIPYHLQGAFDKLICDMEDDGFIEQHSGPVTWLTNPALVPKPDGCIRITVDLRGLNKALLNPTVTHTQSRRCPAHV